MIPIGFAALIVAGGFLLLLPIANRTGEMASPMVAFFTSTSAVTVTGLTLKDTAAYWSSFGQGVIFVLMAVGGLGFMTGATFILIMVGQRITLSDRLLMRESLLTDRLGGLVRLTRQVVFASGLIYLIGMALFFWRFQQYFTGTETLWQAAFHSVSAFNNAGFSIIPGNVSLTPFSSDYFMLSIFAVLIILGGISYTVLVELFRGRRFKRFSLDTKLVLLISVGLWVLGTGVIFGSEYNNENTLGPFSIGGKMFTAFFHSVSARTAGFSTIDMGSSGDFTNLFVVALMFVGGAAGSTAGGIKINSFAVLMVAVYSAIRGRMGAEAFRREIPHSQVYRALAIGVLALFMLGGVVLFFTLYETAIPFPKLLFETVSAFGTVGLSTGATPELSAVGKVVIIGTMFVGRLGPLTLALILAPGEKKEVYRYMQERVKIG
jgi:trk system potassium uptake protein TrkH